MQADLQQAIDKGLDRDGSLGLAFHHAIQDMSRADMLEPATKLSHLFYTPDQVSGFRKIRHETMALAIRTIFGDLSRNGLILSETHPDRGKDIRRNKEWVNHGWEKAFEFCEVLEEVFISQQNDYGVMIIAEMVAHRYGDLSLVGFDYEEKMESLYRKAADLAAKIECQKQMFSPWYWGAFYFMKLGDNDKSMEWFRKYVVTANQYMQDRQPSYREMVAHSLRAVKKILPRKEWKRYRRWFKGLVTNPQMIKAFGTVK